MPARIRAAIALAFLLTLPGCSYWKVGSSATDPDFVPPEAWVAAGKGHHGGISTGWLDEFDDSRMRLFVLESLRNNRNIQATAHRLKAARANVITSRAARLPSVGASGSTSRSYDGLGPGPGDSSESYSLTLNTSWEIDLWGKLRDRDFASRADYEAAVANYRAARLSLAVNTARAWVNLVTAEQQLELATTTLASFKANLGIIERRYQANLLRAVDVQFGRNNVASAERTLRNRTLQRNEAARSLELLLGRYPAGSLEATSELPTLQRDVPAGLPSGLLARRPDLIAARAAVYASAKRASAARKDLLPSVRLTGSAGNADSALRRALDPAYFAYSAAASLSQSVYDGGAPTARAQAALDQNRAAIEDYAQVALEAFREVESALETGTSLQEQETFLQQEVKQAGLAQAQSERDLALGIEGSTVLEILEAQRRAVNSRAALIQLRNQRLQNRLDLHLALGGDFLSRSE